MIYQVENISFAYPGSSRTIYRNCSFELKEGEILSILGPNGAGKSTLLNSLIGILKPQKGNIFLAGRNIRSLTEKEIARQIGYVQQSHNPVFAYTVLDFVLMGCASTKNLFSRPAKEDHARALHILEMFHIVHLADKPYIYLSGGEQQQAMIARAVIHQPKVLLFDEPTSHLDYGRQMITLRMIKKLAAEGYAVILTTHNPDHVLLLGGKVATMEYEGHFSIGGAGDIITEPRLAGIYQAQLHLLDIEELDRTACVPPKL